MGSFVGHVAPGLFFIILSTWWVFVTSYRYIKANRHKNISNGKNKRYSYRGSVTMPCSFCPCKRLRSLPIESMIKFTGLLSQIIGEFIMGTGYANDNGQEERHVRIHEESLHHIIMFSGFLLASFVELLIYFGVPLPKKTVYIINLASGFILVSTILLHLDGRDMIDKHLHLLFGVASVMMTVSYCFEVYDPTNYWATYGRSYFFFVIGTWLIQIAFIMWPISNDNLFIWNPMSKRDMSLITFSFGAHLFSAAVYQIILFSIVNKFYNLIDCCYGKYNDIDDEDDELINRFYYDYQDTTGHVSFNSKYDMILNDIDETEKLSPNDDDY
jgi:hypothetical protein